MNRLTEHDELQNYINGKYKRRMTMELWIAFYAPNGRELCSYTLEGTFDGEMEATKEQLAHARNIQQRRHLRRKKCILFERPHKRNRKAEQFHERTGGNRP
jgi:hypothetical protein